MTEFERMIVAANNGKFRGAQTALAKKLKVNQGTVSRWCSGSTPDPDIQPKLAAALKISERELMALFENQDPAERGAPVPNTGYHFRDIPHLGTVRADRFSFSFDLPHETFSTLAIKGKPGERYATLRISGDCMAPRIEDGDEVLVRQADSVEDGSIAIVCFDSECTMKRVYRKKDGVMLKADNPKYEPKTYASNKVRVLAEVVKIIKDPRRKP